MPQIAEGNSLLRKYRIFATTGTVRHTETRDENVEVDGSPKRVRLQNIFVMGEGGIEHTIPLVNFIVPCTQGQKVTVFHFIPGNRKSGEYFSAYNHNSRQFYNHPKEPYTGLFPNLVAVLAVLMFLMGAIVSFGLWAADYGIAESARVGPTITVGGAVMSLIPGVVLGLVITKIIRFVRSRAIGNNKRYRAYLATLNKG